MDGPTQATRFNEKISFTERQALGSALEMETERQPARSLTLSELKLGSVTAESGPH